MAKKIGSRTITIIREKKRDRLDDSPVAPPTEFDIPGCAILPRTSYEEERGWVIVEGRMVVAPYGSDITADDQVSIKGSTDVWEVDGEPGDYETKRGKGKATIVYLKKAGT
jgi:hypothetical protein